jgi:hypothetical protein
MFMNAVSKFELQKPSWRTAITLTLGFWLSASLVLDWVIMPILYWSGMMTAASFTTAGYAIFWNFNRLEMLAAAVVLTGILAQSKSQSRWSLGTLVLSTLLMSIALFYTYFLTPEMCALGTHFSLLVDANVVPGAMNVLHGSYFLLEVVKLIAGTTLIIWCSKEV